MTVRDVKRIVAFAFVQGKSLRSIAKRFSLSPAVLKSWRQDPEFVHMMQAIEDLENELSDYHLRALKRQAVAILAKALNSKNPKDYQWAVSKLFTLPEGIFFSTPPIQALTESEEPRKPNRPLKPKAAETVDETHEEDRFPEDESYTLASREGLMRFLTETRGRDKQPLKLPD
jgi:transposase-like protein